MPERIMIVDDEAAIGRLLRQALTDRGYLAESVVTGAAALAAFDELPPSGLYHLALVDIMLPDINGLELVARIREKSPATEIILMTGYASVETAVQAIELGAFAYVNKPVKIGELYSVVERALEKQRLLDENRRLLAELKESNRQLLELNKSLEARVSERTRELETVNEITNTIAASLDLGKVLRLVVREIKKLVDFDRASIALAWDSDQINEVYFMEPPAEPDVARGVRYPLRATGIEKVIKTRKALIRRNIAEDGEYAEDDFIRQTGARSGIVVPLIRRGQAIGTLNLGSMKADAYDRAHEKILRQVAGQLAVAIDNANLYRRLEAHSRNLQSEVAKRTASLEASLRELKRAQEKLVQSEKLAATAKLVAGVAHEIKNPLNSMAFATANIENICAVLEAPARLKKPARESIEIIKSDIDSLKEMVDRFMDFARPSLASREKADVSAIVGEVVKGAEPEIKAKRVRVSRNLASGLPPVSLEKGEFRRAVLNLLKNALEAVKPGGRIAVATAAHDGRVEVRVEDDGPGIPAGVRDRIFDIFFTTKAKGAGLGLSQVFRASEIHNGGVTFSDRPGGGTVFRLEIPLEEEAP